MGGKKPVKNFKTAMVAAATAVSVIFGSLAGNAATPAPTPTPTPTATQPITPPPGIYLLKGSDINLVSRESKVPIAIRNTFDSDVRVHVHVNPSNPRVVVPSSVEIVVPAGETVNAQVPVKAVAQGKVFLIVWLTTFSGIRLTKNNYIQMHVDPDIEFALLASFSAMVLALGSVGAVRMVRRRKNTDEDAS